MTGRSEQKTEETRRRMPRWADVAAVVAIALGVGAALMYLDIPYPVGLGPRQPIPFSHRVHVQVKGVSCFMCHTGAASSSRAGIPPLETCLLCHARVIRTYPYIAMLRDHVARNQPVVWERVNWLPEFVYFDHSMHIQRGIDCGACHGAVALMDRVVAAREFQMGFCIQCHRDHNATRDCFTCHR